MQPHLYNIINLNGQRKDSNIVQLHSALGASLLKEDRYSEALSSFEKAYELYKQMSISNSGGLASILNNLAAVRDLLGNYNQCEQFARESLDLCERTLTSDHISVSDALNNLALVLYRQDKYLEAVQLVEYLCK